MAVTFQLAHCVEEADFASPQDLASEPRLWAVHEVETTVNFCPRNRVLTWRNAELHGVRYVAQHSLRAALQSHVRHLRTMGRMGMPVVLEMG